jgi:hypothetical protein
MADLNLPQQLSVARVQLDHGVARLARDPDGGFVEVDGNGAGISARRIGVQELPVARADLRDRSIERIRYPHVAACDRDAGRALPDGDRLDYAACSVGHGQAAAEAAQAVGIDLRDGPGEAVRDPHVAAADGDSTRRFSNLDLVVHGVRLRVDCVDGVGVGADRPDVAETGRHRRRPRRQLDGVFDGARAGIEYADAVAPITEVPPIFAAAEREGQDRNGGDHARERPYANSVPPPGTGRRFRSGRLGAQRFVLDNRDERSLGCRRRSRLERRRLEKLAVDRLGFRRGIGAKLCREKLSAPLVDAQRLGAVAGGRVRRHQLPVARLAVRLQSDCLLRPIRRRSGIARAKGRLGETAQRAHEDVRELSALRLDPVAFFSRQEERSSQ